MDKQNAVHIPLIIIQAKNGRKTCHIVQHVMNLEDIMLNKISESC